MGIGLSVILAAIGAITRFALDPWAIVGDMVMVAGALGVLASILWMAAASHGGATETRRRQGAAER